MDLAGLVSDIYEAAISIDAGRKGFATKGKAEEGRILYEDGIAAAMLAFNKYNPLQTLKPLSLPSTLSYPRNLNFAMKPIKTL